MPPIGPTVAVDVHRAGAGDDHAGDLVLRREPVDDAEREHETRRSDRRCRSMRIVTSTGRSNVGVDEHARAGSRRPRARRSTTSRSSGSPSRRTAERDRRCPARSSRAPRRAGCTSRPARPGRSTRTSPSSTTPCRAGALDRAGDEQVRRDVVAELLERGDRGVLLRRRHRGLVLLVELVLGDVRREDHLDRPDRARPATATRRPPAAASTGKPGPAGDRHRGQPQLAGRVVRLGALDLDERRAVLLAEGVAGRPGRAHRVRHPQEDQDREQHERHEQGEAGGDRPRAGGAGSRSAHVGSARRRIREGRSVRRARRRRGRSHEGPSWSAA